MSIDEVPRHVRFLVHSPSHSGADIDALIAIADLNSDDACREIGAHSWQLSISGSPESDVTSLVDRLFDALAPCLDRLESLAAGQGVETLLRVVQYISSAHPVGPGFTLNRDIVAVLHRLNSLVDVDQYVLDQRSEP